MKTSNFFYQEKNGRKITGTVTLKDNGKISISIFNRSFYSTASKYQAENLAKEIVKLDFKHPNVSNFRQDDEGLLAILKTYTEELRVEYIQKCKIFEAAEFDRKDEWYKSLPKHGTTDWYDKFKIQYEVSKYSQPGNPTYVATNFGDNQQRYYSAKNKIDNTANYLHKGKEKAIETAEKLAEQHYQESISKLAYRIEKKGLVVANLKVEHQRIGINLELTLSDGERKVVAKTIVAEGPIIKPHYRYLVN